MEQSPCCHPDIVANIISGLNLRAGSHFGATKRIEWLSVCKVSRDSKSIYQHLQVRVTLKIVRPDYGWSSMIRRTETDATDTLRFDQCWPEGESRSWGKGNVQIVRVCKHHMNEVNLQVRRSRAQPSPGPQEQGALSVAGCGWR